MIGDSLDMVCQKRHRLHEHKCRLIEMSYDIRNVWFALPVFKNFKQQRIMLSLLSVFSGIILDGPWLWSLAALYLPNFDT